ncbi:MAG: four helix bundle protein [candidate division WOR-3 bacterium]
MTNGKFLMPNTRQRLRLDSAHRTTRIGANSVAGMRASRFDLEERTAAFGSAVVRFAQKVPDSPITRPLVSQLVRAATSIGANCCEADDAESRRDFCHKLGICKKEARGTKHWLRMVVTARPELKAPARKLWQEAKELNLIFNAIVRSTRAKDDE